MQKRGLQASKEAALSSKRQALTIRLRTKGNAVEESSPIESTSTSAQVKEESPDEDIDMRALSSPHSHSSPLPETPPPPPPQEPPQPEPDFIMEEYYRRSRRRGTRELSPFTLEAASAWTWSQVKEPVWVVRSYPTSESHSGETSPDVEKNGESSEGGLRSGMGDKGSGTVASNVSPRRIGHASAE